MGCISRCSPSLPYCRIQRSACETLNYSKTFRIFHVPVVPHTVQVLVHDLRQFEEPVVERHQFPVAIRPGSLFVLKLLRDRKLEIARFFQERNLVITSKHTRKRQGETRFPLVKRDNTSFCTVFCLRLNRTKSVSERRNAYLHEVVKGDESLLVRFHPHHQVLFRLHGKLSWLHHRRTVRVLLRSLHNGLEFHFQSICHFSARDMRRNVREWVTDRKKHPRSRFQRSNLLGQQRNVPRKVSLRRLLLGQQELQTGARPAISACRRAVHSSLRLTFFPTSSIPQLVCNWML